MWPFAKKRKSLIKEPSLEDIRRAITSRSKCPEFQVQTKACVCIECPQKGICSLEKTFAAAGNCNQNFVASCSYKLALKGELDEKEEGSSGSGDSSNRGDFFSYLDLS